MNMNEIFNAVVQNAAVKTGAEDDYINPVDGLKYCGKCHTPKEAYFPDGMDFGGMKTHPAQCRCARELHEKEEQERIAHQTAIQIAELRMDAFRDTGESFRKSNAAENLKKAAQYLNSSTI